MFKLNQFLN